MHTEHVIEGQPPKLWDRQTLGALGTILLAALVIGLGACFLELRVRPFEPKRLAWLVISALSLFRVITMALPRILRRLHHRRIAKRCELILGDSLRYQSPKSSFSIDKDAILDIFELGEWSAHAADRVAEVHLICVPSHRGQSKGEAWFVLPPTLGAPGALVEELMRWRGPTPPRAHVTIEASRTPSKIYDAAAAGAMSAGTSIIRHGRGWLRRGPIAALVMGVLFLIEILLSPEMLSILPLAAMSACFVVPITWWVMMRRQIAPRRGLALVLTPAEAIMRLKSGVLRVPWSRCPKVSVDRFSTWTVLGGREEQRVLVLEREDDTPIRYDEAYLGAPAQVVASLAEAYRKGLVLRPESGPSTEPE